jgi:hypothetical protein
MRCTWTRGEPKSTKFLDKERKKKHICNGWLYSRSFFFSFFFLSTVGLMIRPDDGFLFFYFFFGCALRVRRRGQKENIYIFLPKFFLFGSSNSINKSLSCVENQKRFEILVLLRRSSNLASTRQRVHTVEALRLESFRKMRSIPTSLRWLVKARATTIQRKSSRLVTMPDKIYYSQIYLLDSNFIHIFLVFN